jgi:hypothetical protein
VHTAVPFFSRQYRVQRADSTLLQPTFIDFSCQPSSLNDVPAATLAGSSKRQHAKVSM